MKNNYTLHKNASERLMIVKPEGKRIQPLFKKKFTPMSFPVVAASLEVSNPSHETDFQQPDLRNLNNEKLGIIRDLLTCTLKYENCFSMRARVSKILKLCEKLTKIIQDSQEEIDSERYFLEKLMTSMQGLNSLRISLNKPVELEPDVDESTVKICINISGVYCIALVTYNRNFTLFDLDLHVANWNVIYSYHLSCGIKANAQNIVQKVTENILERLYFTTYQDRLVLRYRESINDEEFIVIKLRGLSKETCICLKEEGSNFILSIADKSIQVEKKALKIESLQEFRNSAKRHQLRNLIESNLSCINGVIAWGLSEWEVMKSLKHKRQSKIIRLNLFDSTQSLDVYEKVILTGTIKLANSNLKIDMIFNTILQLSRIIVHFAGNSIKISEEKFAKQFKLLRKLQRVPICSITMLKSLEFSQFIEKSIVQ